ncbi:MULTISPECIES: ABC transporter [unclassified Streptomyces]|uniref:ABC transporter n=1 Tax=unclassified Streptomyces TaxID=2593676 RepID=UPI00364487FB
MTALLSYQIALLLRSQRWLPPLLLYGIFLVVGVQVGQPILDSLGYAAAALLPVTAWLVRICVTQEPAASRAVVGAVTGTRRAHLAALLAGVVCAGAMAVAGTLIVTLISEPKNADFTVEVDTVSAGTAGLLAAVVCLLLGAAVGALCNRPLLRARGWSIAATVLVSLAALVTSGSPARYAVGDLVTGSLTGEVRTPGLTLVAAVLVAGAAAAVACVLGALRDDTAGD